MALITSTASGNFNAGATWTGGVVPTVGDEARASTGHTITINVNTTCDEVSNDGTGIFTLNDGITLTANVTSRSGTACVQFTAVSPATATIVGNVVSSASASSRGATNTSTGTLSIIGNVTAAAAGGTGNGGATNTSSGILNITGNCTTTSSGVGVNNSSTGSVNITGNCTSASTGVGAGNSSTGTLTITGNVTGGTSTGVGASNSSTGTMIVNGSIYASETASGVSGTNRGQVTRLTGPFYTTATFGVNPIGCLAWRWDTSLVNTTFIEVPTQDLASKRNLVTPDNATNFPSASNVRSGTTYGISGALTGTCAVPSAASVATGVPVDNTTGTASLTPADFWNALTSGMTTSGSIGVRLKNASTLDSTGQQLADALSPVP